MPKAIPKKVALTKSRWAGLFNKTLSKPRSLSTVCNKVGANYLITKCHGVVEKKYQGKTLQQIKLTIKNQSTSAENVVLLSSRYITDLLDEDEYAGKSIYDFDLTGLSGMFFEVMEIREYNDNKYAEIRFYNKAGSVAVKKAVKAVKKKSVKPKPPVVSESDIELEPEDDGEDDDDDSDAEGDDWAITESTSA